jgi:hypothetical protein
MHAQTNDKTDDRENNTNEELECVFCQIPKYHFNVLFGDFNAKKGR